MEDKKHTALTLAEAKDQVAQKHHWDNWKAMQYTGIDEGIFELYQNEASELWNASLTSELKAKEEELTRLKSDPELLRGSIGAELAMQKMELMKENAELRKALTECYAHLQAHTPGGLKAQTLAESALSKHQPIKKDA